MLCMASPYRTVHTLCTNEESTEEAGRKLLQGRINVFYMGLQIIVRFPGGGDDVLDNLMHG